MRIAVCVKRVPDSETRVRISADGKSLDPSGVNFDLGPYDEYALEEALRLKEARSGAAEVVVLCAGPADPALIRKRALAMGADRAVLLKGDFPFSDSASTASALAEALKGLDASCCLFGKQAIDDDSLQVPAWVAQALGWPLVSVVTKLAWEDGKVLAHRQVEGGQEVVEVPLPAAISCQKGLNLPRLVSIPNIMKAKSKLIEEREVRPAEPRLRVLGLSLPPARPAGRIVGQGAEAAAALVRALHEEAKVV